MTEPLKPGDIVRYHRTEGFERMEGAVGIVRQVETRTARVTWITGGEHWDEDLNYHWTPPENAVIFPAEASNGE